MARDATTWAYLPEWRCVKVDRRESRDGTHNGAPISVDTAVGAMEQQSTSRCVPAPQPSDASRVVTAGGGTTVQTCIRRTGIK
jgi:hypothetical protein